jgi:hypothetical protein
MQHDRLTNAIRKIVLDILVEHAEIDFRGFYSATVVSQSGKTLDVNFADKRLKTKSGVALCPTTPGQVPTLAKDTRVLVGWIDGNPDQPYIAGVWLGDGGLVSLDETFSQARRFIGPLTEVKASSSSPVTQVALKGDTVDCGMIVFATAGPGVLTGTYTSPTGVALPFTLGVTIPIQGKVTGPCSTNLKAS